MRFYPVCAWPITHRLAGTETKDCGKITDQTTGEALPNATLSVSEQRINLLTDKEGYFAFTLSDMPLGQYQLCRVSAQNGACGSC